MKTDVEGGTPTGALKQPSGARDPVRGSTIKWSAPLDCSVRRTRVEENRLAGIRASDRAAARASRCQQRSGHVQRRDLVRRAELLRNDPMRCLQPRRILSEISVHMIGGGQASDFGGGARPNKALEPTPTSVTSPADAGAAPAAVVAHL